MKILRTVSKEGTVDIDGEVYVGSGGDSEWLMHEWKGKRVVVYSYGRMPFRFRAKLIGQEYTATLTTKDP